MTYNPNIHNRRSIKLKDYDYSQEGLYFVTICCKNRISYFGYIENGIMILNDAGKMIEKWYWELENKFPDIRCHEMVVMPNHFHCIIQNVGIEKNVGADLCVCPKPYPKKNVGADLCVCPKPCICTKTMKEGEHIGSPLRDSSKNRSFQNVSSLSNIVQWFKTMTTNEYIRGVKKLGWQRFDGKLWQRNYWEHIIRNEKSLEQIANYINENPSKWYQDKLFGQ